MTAAIILRPVSTPAASSNPASPRIVINEIMFHPPEERDDLQFIELFNADSLECDLSRWSFSKGIDFTFPPGARLAPSACAVICRDLAAFQAHYGAQITPAGVFTKRLSHKGETVQLVHASGRVVDTVKYDDRDPWPMGADGYGPSLERLSPNAPSHDPGNWISSDSRGLDVPSGTPGSRNSHQSDAPAPVVNGVRFEPAAPARSIMVTAAAADSSGLAAISLHWFAGQGGESPQWTELDMPRISGDERNGDFQAVIPGQPPGRLIRFYVVARGRSGVQRRWPGPNEPRPTFTTSTFTNTNPARIPILEIHTLGALQPPAAPRFRPRPRRPGTAPEPTPVATAAVGSAIVYCPPGGAEPLLLDHVQVRPRNGGVKVHFLKDQPLQGMTGINVIFEGPPRQVLSEALAYDLFRKAGVPTPHSEHVRLSVDGHPAGYHLLVEQPNKAFLRRHGRDEEGNLYKLLWYGRGLVEQHEKKINAHTGHDDLVQLIEGLRNTSPSRQWEFIQQNFQVEEVISYYAVNMCIQNWDGFFNNYFAYHAPGPDGRWEVFPWDEDKTWGDYDGAARDYDWYSMPLTVGREGDQPQRTLFGGGPFGGGNWWRPPGHFSGPLLANPEFRRRFLLRVRELCETVFTPQTMDPAINAIGFRLEDEVRLRATLHGESPASAVRDFRRHIDSFRRQVVHRRQWLLKALDDQ